MLATASYYIENFSNHHAVISNRHKMRVNEGKHKNWYQQRLYLREDLALRIFRQDTWLSQQQRQTLSAYEGTPGSAWQNNTKGSPNSFPASN